MSVVDASVLISAFIPQEENHQSSREWLQTQTKLNNPIIAPMIVLAEVGGSIARRANDNELAKQAINFILKLPTLRVITIDETVGQLASNIAITHRIRGMDAIYTAIAEQLNLALVTLDKEQAKRSSTIVNTLSPKDHLAQITENDDSE